MKIKINENDTSENAHVASCVNNNMDYTVEKNKSKIRAPCKTVLLRNSKNLKRLKSAFITSPIKIQTIGSCIKNKGHHQSRTKKKLGVRTRGRTHHGRLKSTEDLKVADINGKNETENMNVEMIRDGETTVERDESEKLNIDYSQMPDENNDEFFSSADENVSSESSIKNDSNQITSNINDENNSSQLDLSNKIIIKSEPSSIEEDELISTLQSIDSSINSNIEYDNMCHAIKNDESILNEFSFESIDITHDFDNLKCEIDHEILSNMSESSIDKEMKSDPLKDPLAPSPQKMNVEIQSTNELLSMKCDNERKLLNKRRRSTRLQKKLNKQNNADENEFESDDTDDSNDFSKIRKKIKRLDESEVSIEILEQLKDLNIQLEHEPACQHKLETYISRPPPMEIKKSFVKYGPLKKGSYSISEDETIIKNWKRFCQIHNWDPEKCEPFLHDTIRRKKVLSSQQRIKFAQFLATELPWRSLYSIYGRFRILFSKKNCKRNTFTPEQDEQILIYIDNEKKFSRKCYKLGQLFGRSQISIRNRYQLLKNRKEEKSDIKKHVQWDLPLIEKFLKYLLDVTLSDSIYDLKNAIIPKVVWIELEKKLKISHETMMYFWKLQLHSQLFYKRPIYENDLKIMLIEYIYVKGISQKKELIWSNIAKCFDGLTPRYLSRLFFSMIHNSYLRNEQNFAEVIDWLYNKKIPRLIAKEDDRYLPRLNYKDGKIEIIEDSSSSSSSPMPPSSPSPSSPSSSLSYLSKSD